MQVGCMYSAYPFLRHVWTDLDGLAWDDSVDEWITTHLFYRSQRVFEDVSSLDGKGVKSDEDVGLRILVD